MCVRVEGCKDLSGQRNFVCFFVVVVFYNLLTSPRSRGHRGAADESESRAMCQFRLVVPSDSSAINSDRTEAHLSAKKNSERT